MMLSRSLLSRLPQTSASEEFSGPLMKVLWKAMMVAGYEEIYCQLLRKKEIKIIYFIINSWDQVLADKFS